MTNGTGRTDDTFDFASPAPVAPPRHAVPVVAVAVGVVLLVIVAGVAVSELRRPGPATAAGGAPNILVIVADDMPLYELRYLPNVENLLIRQGTQFSNFYTTTSNCCPSRGGYYTGQYRTTRACATTSRPAGRGQLVAAAVPERVVLDPPAGLVERPGRDPDRVGRISDHSRRGRLWRAPAGKHFPLRTSLLAMVADRLVDVATGTLNRFLAAGDPDR